VNALASALQVNKTLTTLHIGVNNLGAEVGKALATALQVNKTLTTLNLDNNNLGAEGVKALAAALQVNKTLTTLSLYGNNLGAEIGKALAAALQVNKTLTTLSLYDNDLGDGGSIILEAIFSHCTRNLAIKCRIEEHWAEVAIVFGFVKANRENSIKYSILSLVPAILTMADLQQNLKKDKGDGKDKEEAHSITAAAKKTKPDIPFISRFIDSRYFKALLVESSQKLEPLTTSVGSAGSVASAEGANKGALPIIFSSTVHSASGTTKVQERAKLK
jgi:Ran GTPase-activating protein (RanGAP) involved in mRNA processing and transport